VSTPTLTRTSESPWSVFDLPSAPTVTRADPVPWVRRRGPAVALLIVGVLLVFGPIVGGLFSTVAAGQQLISSLAPHLDQDSLDRYDADLVVLGRGAAALDDVYASVDIPSGRFVGIDAYRKQADVIDQRASGLLDRVRAAAPDYWATASIGGFDRIPFLLVGAGLAASYAGAVLVFGDLRRARGAVALAVVAAVAVGTYPWISNLADGTRAGHRLIGSFEPVMSADQVRAQQLDFVALVHAVGEVDTGFRDVPKSKQAERDLAALIEAWPQVSSDLADLVGSINDNLPNYDALVRLDAAPPGDASGFAALPSVLTVVGGLIAVLALAAWPRRRILLGSKEKT
jgi:hypothetical protein